MKYRPRRVPCDFPVRVATPNGTAEGAIRSVHAEGAKLVGVRGLAAGDACKLVIDAIPVQASVRWVSGDAAGLRFGQKLTSRQFEVVSRVVLPRARASLPVRRDWGYTQLR